MTNLTIQEKATAFIKRNNLIDILQSYGKMTIVGSYRMQVMTWNDLDFYIDLSDFESEKYYNLVAELIAKLKPVRFDCIHNLEKKSFFLGLEIMYEEERWNLDIWWKTKAKIDASISYTNDLMQQMQQYPHLKEAVLDIKQGLINRKLYGFDKGKKHYHSNEIYDAIFNKGILTAEEFITQYS